MAEFRIYFLNSEGRIGSAEVLEADDDSRAMEVFQKLDHCYGLELWQRERRVAVRVPTLLPNILFGIVTTKQRGAT
jgi:hypothetical protein